MKKKEVDNLRDVIKASMDLRKVNDMLIERIYYKFLVDSAIKFIKEHKPIWEEWHYDGYDVDSDIEKLLKILEGCDKEC